MESLDVHHFWLTQHGDVLDEPRGGVTQHHATFWRHRFHALRHTNLLADDGVGRCPRIDFTGDYLTGIQTHAQPQLNPIVAFDLSRQGARFALDVQRSKACPNSVVLKRKRRAKRCHDPVAGELVDRAAIALYDGGCMPGELAHDLPESFRTYRRRKIH
jgi:hypothetical protein